jgi:hypothetical protein
MYEGVKYGREYSKRFEAWYLKNQERIQFGSAKRYNRINLRFLDTIRFYDEQYGSESFAQVASICSSENAAENYERLIAFNKTCKNHGRFSSDLFNEILIMYNESRELKLNIRGSDVFDWDNCANLTSAVFNIMYRDDLADEFDKGTLKGERLKPYRESLQQTILAIQRAIKDRYGVEVDTPMFVTKLCSFRNLFKQSRYGGFHHDRQLEYILKYAREFPETKELLAKMLRYRAESYAPYLLGEKKGWRGVRKKRKKIWRLYGYTGVEREAQNILNE